MAPVISAQQVFESIQRVKAASDGFFTNFFPVESKLKSWIAHGEFLLEQLEDIAFFLRKDRGFFHLYFCAASIASLPRALQTLPCSQTERVAADLIGPKSSIENLASAFEESGFRKYAHLIRLARPAAAAAPNAPKGPSIEFAHATDCSPILELLEESFDPYADQLPLDYEIRAAVENRQIFVTRQNGVIAALLHFETQGASSVLRFWAVREHFRASGFGSALIRHYFASQTGVRRFTLWVNASNENAVQKYGHYGYAPDGLGDQILANSLITR